MNIENEVPTMADGGLRYADNYTAASTTDSERLTFDIDPGYPVAPGKMREVWISELNYGYILTIGCHKFAFETHERALANLAEYMKDPDGVERKWFANELAIKRNRA